MNEQLVKSDVFFFTATILEWKHLLIENHYKDIIIQSLDFLVKDDRIDLYAFVIMPNHLHLLLYIKNKLMSLKAIQRDFLKFTAQQIKLEMQKNNDSQLSNYYVGAKDREYQIWERNAFSFEIYTTKVFEQKLNYIHMNPCSKKWSLAVRPEDYKYSSASYYLKGKSDWSFLRNFMEDFY